MSDKITSGVSRPNITIPDEAFKAAVNVSGTMRKLEHAAPLILAAELQRIADAIDTLSAVPGDVVLRAEAAGRREIRQVLLGRASELRGVGSHEAPEPENQT